MSSNETLAATDQLVAFAAETGDALAGNAAMLAAQVSGLIGPWLPQGLDRSLIAYGLAAIAVLLFAALAMRAIRRRRERRARGGVSLSHYVRGPRRLGFATVVLFFGGLGGLAAMVPLAGAALAPGVVSPDGSRKTVQHLEGGIIQRIHVREGDVVEPGDPLVTLEDIQARANFAELSERLAHLLSVEARLSAELTGAATVTFPQELLDMGPSVDNVLAGQRELFASRHATRDGRERIYAQRIVQLRDEIDGIREVTIAQDEEISLLEQEIATVEGLIAKKLERTPRLLLLKRAVAELQGERAENRTRISRNEQQVGQTEMELLTLRQQDNEKINAELVEVRAELAALRSKLPARQDVLARTVISAPIAGTVMNVLATTETGVVRAGEPLLDIVPRDGGLVIDARIKPIDIDVVTPGMQARVVLLAYVQRNLPQISGVLRSVSADRLVDERTGEPYFLAKIEVDEAALQLVDETLELMPGMPADVFILTGERTALDYLFRPFTVSITRSFLEN